MEIKQSEAEFERWERIDGVVYDMTPPPSSDHQKVVSRLQGEFYAYLKGKTCQSFVAPFAVYLDETENGNYVEPDITIICDPSKIHKKGCIGVPDMVVEVLSPSTAAKDKRTKLKRYRLSGVKEYWIIDPVNQYLEVYKLSENVFTEPQVYANDETVKVGIFEDFKINLHDIFG
ncbi:Uma2 family endonuclease [Microaerobacter geothermalis]|uniref:Uma2 family endonuclease n=1 Tax=Microaerobacter geothermalis TaxID=674972 RepID=UPI001F215722|nr:Uma2 family endonuclease [Microaerobacter geothermalis]MCF6093733.1 Uma2 family endonuclease [Microaerobacter geothermalis]